MSSQTHPTAPERRPADDPTATPPAPAPAYEPATGPTDGRPQLRPQPRGHLRRIVAGALAAGLVAALLLVAAPFVPAQEDGVTGAVLIGFAVGWAMLAVLSARFTAAPQRWAAVPAAFMGFGGLLLVAFGPSVRPVLDWVWPPAALVLAIWMIDRARRRLPSGGGRWLLYPVIAGLALASIGGGYETARAAADVKAHPMPGRLVDVGGHRLHLNCTGTGTPTVVLEAGGGEVASNFGWITPAVARATRVCAYDRAGRGWSEPADAPQDGAQVATDLHTLLHRADIPGPYVLAGHSFGGLYVLAFADRYPAEVAGMVLVDSTAPVASAVPSTASHGPSGDGALRRISALVSTVSRFGLGRVYAQLAVDGLPPRARDEVRVSMATPGALGSTIEEYVQASASMRDAAALRDFGRKPLVVLTAGVGHDATWATAQDQLATLSANTAHRVVAGATHEGLVGDETYAAATTQAIVDVVSSTRTGRPLAR